MTHEKSRCCARSIHCGQNERPCSLELGFHSTVQKQQQHLQWCWRSTTSHAGTLCLLAGRKASAGRQAGPCISSAVSGVPTGGVKGAACRLAAARLPRVARLPVTLGVAVRNQKMMLHHAPGPHGCCNGPDRGHSHGTGRPEARLVADRRGMGAVDLRALRKGRALVAFCGTCHQASVRCR